MWECFCDDCYYGMYAVRHTSDKSFSSAIHVMTKEEAEFICEKLNELQILKNTDENRK
jgi:hypothetical protein